MKNQDGFSLIEVIVAIAIVAILGLALLEIFGLGITNVSKAGERTEDIYSLQQVMDDSIRSVEKGEIEALPFVKTLNTGGDKVLVKIREETLNVNSKIILGKLITVEIEGTNRTLTTFVPE